MADEAMWTEAIAPRLSRGQAMALWFWCWSGARERERDVPAGATAAPDPVATRLRFEASQCLRVQAALERNHQDRGSYQRCVHDPIEERLARGLDSIGAAYFSRYLAQQARYWRERAQASAEERVEAEARLAVSLAASEVFHRILGASPAEVASAAESLPMKSDPRGRLLRLTLGECLIEDEFTEGPITVEEKDRRTEAAIRALEERKVIHD